MVSTEENASPGLLAPLKDPTFRSILVASQLSSLGWLMQTVALGWLMATVSSSEVLVALVQASSTLPAFFLAVSVGAIADNYSRRVVMIVGRSLMMAASAMLTILMAFGIHDPWMILAFSFLDGCGIALSDPCRRRSKTADKQRQEPKRWREQRRSPARSSTSAVAGDRLCGAVLII